MKYSILNNHIAIQGWMVEELGLRGNKLLIFAIIWGFTGNLKSANKLENWSVNYRYIESWTGLGEYMIDVILHELSDDHLINWDAANCIAHVNKDFEA